MEPEVSLPQSQMPATCPYPEPSRSSPHHQIHFLKIHLNIFLPSTPGSSKWSLSFRFPDQNPVYASPLPICATCPPPSHSRFYHQNSLSPHYTGCPRRNGQNFGRVFLMLNYTDITQNTCIQNLTVTEIMAIEKCGLLGCPRTVSRPWRHTHHCACPATRNH